MNTLKSHKLIIALTIILTTTFFACTPPNSQTNIDSSNKPAPQDVQEPEPPQPQIQMPPELSKEESDKFQSSLTLDERMSLAYELVDGMPSNGMEPMTRMFPDLIKIKDVSKDDPQNLLKLDAEAWFYSEEADATVIVFFLTGSPMYVIDGREPTQEQIAQAAESTNSRYQNFLSQEDQNPEVEEVAEEEITPEEIEAESETESEEEPVEDFEVIIPYDQEDPQYVDYTDELFMKYIAQKPMVIFFHANWCETCQRLNTDISEAIDSFPKGTKILKADFDKVKRLREDYNIILQSTFVVIDKDGNVITKLSVPTNEQLIEAIKNSL